MSEHGKNDRDDPESSLICICIFKSAISDLWALSISNKLLTVSLQLVFTRRERPVSGLGECF